MEWWIEWKATVLNRHSTEPMSVLVRAYTPLQGKRRCHASKHFEQGGSVTSRGASLALKVEYMAVAVVCTIRISNSPWKADDAVQPGRS
ncbi:hypothetical protein JTE90_019261 [Oedothorax gibbosus]|uniref:Uncharacterized protein n=1 Tax=Oedothorax gibbosus TaxID=931172 RepID=A0AAV6UUW6_9ARAC|nr:hypothetical protein JTE90_019261 [Oedothorax gibbosus]